MATECRKSLSLESMKFYFCSLITYQDWKPVIPIRVNIILYIILYVITTWFYSHNAELDTSKAQFKAKVISSSGIGSTI